MTSAIAQQEPRALGTWIAKSTFVNLADADDKVLQPRGFAYLPPGTRFVAFDKIQPNYLGQDRRLILTESGIWAYIPDSDKNFWNPQRLDVFTNSKGLAIIRTRQFITYKLSEDVQLNIWFTPSELYPIVEENEDNVTIRVGHDKLKGLAQDTSYNVKVARSLVAQIDTNSLNLDWKNIQDFRRSVVEKIVGVQKACNSQQVRTLKLGGAAGLDFTKLFSFLKLEASAEQKTIEDFGPEVNVTRWYYRRGDSGDVYRVTKKQNCQTGKLNYSYVNPAGFEIEFRIGREDQKKFPFEPDSGRVLVTCANDYFALSDYLMEFGFQQSEIPFLISRTARFKATLDAAKCSHPH